MPELLDRPIRGTDAQVRASAEEQEPTLGAVMRALASRRPPRQVLEGVWVLIPWAFYFASIGWWRSAAGIAALGSFGVWAAAHRWTRTATVPWRRAGARALRIVAGVAMAILAGGLALALFLPLLGRSPIS